MIIKDPKWFNNPQFRIKVTRPTQVIVSLMQEDKDPLENSPDLQKNIPSKGMGLSAMINSTTLKNSYSTIFSLKI